MKRDALNIVQTLRDAGFLAFWVGGCVRDVVMGRTPDDYDLVTDAAPDQVTRLFRHTVPVGAQFGIVMVVQHGQPFEVAQFRGIPDILPPDLPALLRADAMHRDFTVNAMFYDPVTAQLFDFFEGQQDIQQRTLRGILDPRARFLEDRLRMMRAVRFAAAFDFTLEPTTFQAMQELASQINTVSVERIREELLKILCAPHADQGLRLLVESGLLAQILPEVAALQGVPQPPEFHPEGDVFTHTRLMLRHLRDASPELALSVLLHDIGKPATLTHTDRIRFHGHAQVGARMAEEVCMRLKCATKMTNTVVSLVREHQIFTEVAQMKKSTLKRLLRQEYFPALLELHRLDRLSSRRDLRHYEFCQAQIAAFQQDALRPPRLISGQDLAAFGLPPGPLFKQVLEAVENAQLEGTITTRQHALAFAEDCCDTLRQAENLPE